MRPLRECIDEYRAQGESRVIKEASLGLMANLISVRSPEY